jgi:hypothetical protein
MSDYVCRVPHQNNSFITHEVTFFRVGYRVIRTNDPDSGVSNPFALEPLDLFKSV